VIGQAHAISTACETSPRSTSTRRSSDHLRRMIPRQVFGLGSIPHLSRTLVQASRDRRSLLLTHLVHTTLSGFVTDMEGVRRKPRTRARVAMATALAQRPLGHTNGHRLTSVLSKPLRTLPSFGHGFWISGAVTLLRVRGERVTAASRSWALLRHWEMLQAAQAKPSKKVQPLADRQAVNEWCHHQNPDKFCWEATTTLRRRWSSTGTEPRYRDDLQSHRERTSGFRTLQT
jgi:hypothetical protein